MILAAEIGQSLVEENNNLKIEYERIISDISTSDDKFKLLDSADLKLTDAANLRYKDLECAHIDVLNKYDSLKREHQTFSETDKAHKASMTRLEQEQIRMQDDLVQQLELIETLQDEKRVLAKEKIQLVKLTQDLNAAQQGGEGIVSELLSNVHRLEGLVDTAQDEHQILHGEIEQLQSENRLLVEKCQELEELLESYHSFQETCQVQSDAIVQLTGEVEFLRDTNTRLSSRLSFLEPASAEGTSDGSKTLLGEIEDRRQMLAVENQALFQKHAGLVKGIIN